MLYVVVLMLHCHTYHNLSVCVAVLQGFNLDPPTSEPEWSARLRGPLAFAAVALVGVLGYRELERVRQRNEEERRELEAWMKTNGKK
eukprot:7182751-Prymnesium_polylepis.1